jgi:hypothetical protein
LSDAAEVDEEVEFCSPERAAFIGLQKLARLHWRKPPPVLLSEGERAPTSSLVYGATFWRLVERLLRRIGKISMLSRIVPRQPTEFGLFVRMTKKDAYSCVV